VTPFDRPGAAAEAMVNMTGYQVVPIGWVESPLKDRAQAPRQGDEGAPDAWLVFQPEVAEGLRDLAPGAEIIVLTWLDRAARSSQVSTMISVPAARSRIPLGELGLEDQPGVRRALVPLPRRLPPVGQRRLDPSDRHYLIAPHVHQRLPPRAAGMTTSVTVAAIPRHQPMRMTDPRCPGRLTTRCRVYTASIQPRIPVEVALPPNCPAAR